MIFTNVTNRLVINRQSIVIDEIDYNLTPGNQNGSKLIETRRETKQTESFMQNKVGQKYF